MADSAHYTLREVAALLSMKEGDARECDTEPRSWLGLLSPDGPSSGGSADGPPLPMIARWHDVQAAKRRVERRRDLHVTTLWAVTGDSTEVAELTDLSERHVRRRIHADAEAVLDELGGASEVDQDAQLVEVVEHALARLRS